MLGIKSNHYYDLAMQSTDQSFASPDLEAAIDRHPLIVQPDVLLVQAIALMGRARGNNVSLMMSMTQNLYSMTKIFLVVFWLWKAQNY